MRLDASALRALNLMDSGNVSPPFKNRRLSDNPFF